MTSVADVAAAIGSGTIRVVDLTNPLSSSTPTLRLPEPFANLVDFSLEQVSAYDAPYVALAEALDATLLTRDERLARTTSHSARIEVV